MSRTRRGRASEIHDLPIRVEGEGRAAFDGGRHSFAGRVAGSEDDAREKHDIARFESLDILEGERGGEVDGVFHVEPRWMVRSFLCT